MRTPDVEQLLEIAVRGVLHHGMSEASVEGTMMRTSTPRFTALPKASIASGSGMK